MAQAPVCSIRNQGVIAHGTKSQPKGFTVLTPDTPRPTPIQAMSAPEAPRPGFVTIKSPHKRPHRGPLAPPGAHKNLKRACYVPTLCDLYPYMCHLARDMNKKKTSPTCHQIHPVFTLLAFLPKNSLHIEPAVPSFTSTYDPTNCNCQ